MLDTGGSQPVLRNDLEVDRGHDGVEDEQHHERDDHGLVDRSADAAGTTLGSTAEHAADPTTEPSPTSAATASTSIPPTTTPTTQPVRPLSAEPTYRLERTDAGLCIDVPDFFGEPTRNGDILEFSDGGTTRLDVASGEVSPLFGKLEGGVAYGDACWSRDGERLYFVSDLGGEFMQLQCLDFASGEITTLSAEIAWNVTSLDLSPDGSHLVFAVNKKLTPEAAAIGTGNQIYDYTGGQLHLVSILPNATTFSGGAPASSA